MAKEIILMEDVDGLGVQGDVVKAADGYVRNYLFPKNLAAPVTEATRRQLDTLRKQRASDFAGQKSGAEKLAKTVEQTSCTVAVKTGEGGKLFGSVTSADIVKVLKDQGLAVDKNQVVLDQPIRELGVFTVSVKLHPEVEATLKVWVVEE